MRHVRVTIFVCALASLAYATAHATSETDIPPDFRITIHDYPGMSEWKPFETTIAADGTVQQNVYAHERWQMKRSVIQRRAVTQLFDAVKKADFFSLAAEYPTDASDCVTYVVDVRAGGRTHKVRFATCFRVKGTEKESKRFLEVWVAALRAYPSPNREQKPEDYER